ncbi:hypothetical protein CR513_01498, partial [Mucuna pruriens]
MIGTAELKFGLYAMSSPNMLFAQSHSMNNITSSNCNLWDRRLGHPSLGTLTAMKKIYHFIACNNSQDPCSVCHMTKQKRLPFVITFKVIAQIKLLGKDLNDQRVVEKNFGMSSIELINALQATKKMRSLRMGENIEGALMAHTNDNKGGGWKNKFPPYPHYNKNNHFENLCWFRPSIKCRVCN